MAGAGHQPTNETSHEYAVMQRSGFPTTPSEDSMARGKPEAVSLQKA